MPTLLPFFTFKHEGGVIGRLLAGYTNLEIGLLNCVQVATSDFDATLKAMFRIRGETERVLKAEKLGEPAYKTIKLDSAFRAAVGSIRHCLKIRNQYAHCVWWDDFSGQLAFANIEEVAWLGRVLI
jgi:hypothetical protein